MVNQIAPHERIRVGGRGRPRTPTAGRGRFPPPFWDFTGRKSNVDRSRPPISLSVSIAAQRRNLARSLLEWRLHGSATLGNMDQ
ncbi:hypothetical protein AYJ54_03110 [Bradyrhizobium centrolobii]|uniref:Uncharacterized protein n=1 Tax=Bradyrhizobium centrolobii TaxID=1505087 RepID=A0A176YDS5_9BRAD|nr:hypothetical protein AYJ54_03110 [Bradyrhizobium centrolobii]